MNLALNIVLWAVAWVLGVLVIGLAASQMQEPFSSILALGGGFAWGYGWTTFLFKRVLT